jgi:hypothetical protein
MPLAPVSRLDTPSYPTGRRARRGRARWLRRIAAAAGLSAAMAGVGCFNTAYPGDVAMPAYFACSDGPRESVDEYDEISGEGSFWGTLCEPPSDAWGLMDVEEGYTARFELVDGAQRVVVHVVDADGEEMAQLDADQPALDLWLEPGRVSLVVEALGEATGSFEIAISEAEGSG